MFRKPDPTGKAEFKPYLQWLPRCMNAYYRWDELTGAEKIGRVPCAVLGWTSRAVLNVGALALWLAVPATYILTSGSRSTAFPYEPPLMGFAGWFWLTVGVTVLAVAREYLGMLVAGRRMRLAKHRGPNQTFPRTVVVLNR